MDHNFSNLKVVPAITYSTPRETLSYIRIRTKESKCDCCKPDYDNKKLYYHNLKMLSERLGQGRTDFLLSKLGLKYTSFYKLIENSMSSGMILPILDDSSKIKKIEENIENIENSIKSINEYSSSNSVSIIEALDVLFSVKNDMHRSIISNEDIFTQINKNSKKYVDFVEMKPIKPPVDNDKIPPTDSNETDKGESNSVPVEENKPIESVPQTPINPPMEKPELPVEENKPIESIPQTPINPPIENVETSNCCCGEIDEAIEEKFNKMESSIEDLSNSQSKIQESINNINNILEQIVKPPVEKYLKIDPEFAVVKKGEVLRVCVEYEGGSLGVNGDNCNCDNAAYNVNYSDKYVEITALKKGSYNVEFVLYDISNDSILLTKILKLEIIEEQVEPQPPEEDLSLEIFNKNIEMIVGESNTLSFKTNATNVIVRSENERIASVEKDEFDDYNVTALEEGNVRIAVIVSDGNSTKTDYICIKIRESYMPGYPIISEPDENGIKWMQKSEGSDLIPLYPDLYVEWNKLLEQEKRRIPARIMKKEHRKEIETLDGTPGVVYDEKHIPQYSPTYKYLTDMSRKEMEEIPLNILTLDDKIFIYGDVHGNILLGNQVYYKPTYKAYSIMTDEERRALDFNVLYLIHKLDLYGDDNDVIKYNDKTYYPPIYKEWSELSEEEKKSIDKDILSEEHYEEIYTEETPPELPETELSMNPENIDDVKVDEEVTSTATTNADTVSADSANPEIATVTVEGKIIKVLGKSKGQTTVNVKATAADSKEKVVSMNVNVSEKTAAELPETELSLEPLNIDDVKIDEEANVTATTNAETVSAESANPETASVTVEGKIIKVLGKGKGQTTVTVKATAADSKEKISTFNVNVSEKEKIVTSIDTVNKTPTVKIGKFVEIDIETNASEIFANAEFEEKIGVEVIGKKVKITGKQEGNSKVFVRATAEGAEEVTLEINVTIENLPATELTLNPETLSIKKGEKGSTSVTTNADSFAAESKDTGKVTVEIRDQNIEVTGVEIGENVEVEVKSTATDSLETVKKLLVTVTENEQA